MKKFFWENGYTLRIILGGFLFYAGIFMLSGTAERWVCAGFGVAIAAVTIVLGRRSYNSKPKQ